MRRIAARSVLHGRGGVRQGCPWSHLLFSLYVNDVSSRFPESLGARAGVDGVVHASHLMYADDLTLLAIYLRRVLPRNLIASHRVESGIWYRPVKPWRDRVCELYDVKSM